jgi:hypothetical protein
MDTDKRLIYFKEKGINYVSMGQIGYKEYLKLIDTTGK